MEKKLIGIDLSIASKEVIELLLDDPADITIYSEIYKTNQHRPEVLKLLYEHPNTPLDIVNKVSESLSLPVKTEIDKEIELRDFPTEEAKQKKAKSIHQCLHSLSIGEKIQLALRGGKEIRTVLLRDPNREVVMKVLENPKITESEIEMAAKNPQIPKEALRFISKKRDWIKKYPIILALVSNPKTPPGISISFIGHLRTHDLVILEKDKNIPAALRTAVKRHLRIRRK